jgi:hypothetical protein
MEEWITALKAAANKEYYDVSLFCNNLFFFSLSPHQYYPSSSTTLTTPPTALFLFTWVCSFVLAAHSLERAEVKNGVSLSDGCVAFTATVERAAMPSQTNGRGMETFNAGRRGAIPATYLNAVVISCRYVCVSVFDR